MRSIATAPIDRAPATLVRLGKQRSGAPVFFCHALSGHAWLWNDVVQQLALSRPAFATQAPDLEWKRSVLSLPEMVAQYAADIRMVQRAGPYALVGYSFGGLLAFEIARRLLRDGSVVRPLVLLDTPGPGFRYRPAAMWRRTSDALSRIVCDLRAAGRVPDAVFRRLGWSGVEAACSCFGTGELSVAELRRLVGVVFPHAVTDPDALDFDTLSVTIVEEFRKRLSGQEWDYLSRYAVRHDPVGRIKALKVFRKNMLLAHAYRPSGIYPGPITIYAAADNPTVHRWQRYTSEPLDVRTVAATEGASEAEFMGLFSAGAHLAFLDPHNLALFVDDLRWLLDDA